MIEELLKHKVLIENDIGKSSSNVYKILDLENGQNGYVKQDTKWLSNGVNHEVEVYRYLRGKALVPVVYLYEYPYLVTYEIKGIPSFKVKEDQTIKLIAKALKELHQ